MTTPIVPPTGREPADPGQREAARDHLNRLRQQGGTYRSIAPKHAPRYLAEFEYRFNRRYDLAAMLPRLATAAAQTPPMPYRLLKLAEVAG